MRPTASRPGTPTTPSGPGSSSTRPAGDADGDGIREKDGQKFQVEWLSIAGVNEYQAMLAAIQQWWRDVGVEMTPRFVDFPTILDTQDTHDFQVMNLAFNWTPPSGTRAPCSTPPPTKAGSTT